MAEKQTARKNNWQQKYNNLVKAYVELYFPLCTCFINEIIPRIDEAQFDLMCSKYSLDAELVLALISKLGKNLVLQKKTGKNIQIPKSQIMKISKKKILIQIIKLVTNILPSIPDFKKATKETPKAESPKKVNPHMIFYQKSLIKK